MMLRREKFFVDHINGYPIDNTTRNLRIVTSVQNHHNRRKNKKNTSSKYKGVTWDKKSSVWRAQITNNKKHIHLRFFNTEEEAAKPYNEAAKKYFGEYARLNEFYSTKSVDCIN